LGVVLALEYGKSLPAAKRVEGPYPVYGSNGVVGTNTEPLIRGPGIVVGRKGTVGAVRWSEQDYWPIDTTYFVQPLAGHDLRWLYYLLEYLPLQDLNSATGVPGLNRNDAYDLLTPLPPLPEQRR